MIAGQRIGAHALDGLLYLDEYQRIYAGLQTKPDLAIRIDGADIEERRALRKPTPLESVTIAQQLAVKLNLRARLHQVRAAWSAITELNDDLTKGAMALVSNCPLHQADEEFNLNFQDFINRRRHSSAAEAPILGSHLEDLEVGVGLAEELEQRLPFLHWARLVRVIRPPQSVLGFFEVELVDDQVLIDREDYYAKDGPVEGAELGQPAGERALISWRKMLRWPLPPELVLEKIEQRPA